MATLSYMLYVLCSVQKSGSLCLGMLALGSKGRAMGMCLKYSKPPEAIVRLIRTMYVRIINPTVSFK